MTLTGPSPRELGENLRPVRQTKQRLHLSVVPFLEPLLGLHVESPMRQLEMLASPVSPRRLVGDALFCRGLLHKARASEA